MDMIEPEYIILEMKTEPESDDESQVEIASDSVSSTVAVPPVANNNYTVLNIPTSSYQYSVPKSVAHISQSTQNRIPANINWSGDYKFDISFGPQEKITKSTKWTYSEVLEKLYVNLAVATPVRFHVSKPPPSNSIIRAMPIFSKPEHITDVVKRCLNHSLPTDSFNEDHPAPEHLIRCDNSNVQYVEDSTTRRQSVIAQYESPQVGMDYSTYLYRFMCLGSCVGGLNRRPIQIIFTLENGGCCLGRKVVEIRICACPGRDRKIEEKHHEKAQQEALKKGCPKICVDNSSVGPSPSKKFKSSSEDDEYVIIRIRRQHYDHIKRILDGLEVLEVITKEQSTFLQQRQLQRQMISKSKKHKKDTSSEDEH